MVDTTNNTHNAVISRRTALGLAAAASATAAAHAVQQKATSRAGASPIPGNRPHSLTMLCV